MMYIPCQENQYHRKVHCRSIFEVSAMIGFKLVCMFFFFLSLYCTYIIPLESMHILLYEVPPIGTGFVYQNTCGILHFLV